MSTVLKEVGVCNCMEHQSASRLRTIIKEKEEELRLKDETIRSLRMDLYYWKDHEDSIGDNGTGDLPGSGVRGSVAPSQTESRREEQLRLPGVQG